MTRKTKKDLEKEITSLKDGFQELKTNYDNLSVKYESLKVKFNQGIFKAKLIFKCNLCDLQFEKQGEFKKHRKIQHTSVGKFTCEECDKLLSEEWKLQAHVKSSTKYPCDHCEKIFMFNETLSYHITAAHEHLKLYCHFFNNNKECPKKDQCL